MTVCQSSDVIVLYKLYYGNDRMIPKIVNGSSVIRFQLLSPAKRQKKLSNMYTATQLINDIVYVPRESSAGSELSMHAHGT